MDVERTIEFLIAQQARIANSEPSLPMTCPNCEQYS